MCIRDRYNCSNYKNASWNLRPHVAAIGMTFYTGSMFPSSYTNQAFICEHGSWNRKEPSGYRVMMASLHDDNISVSKYKPFVSGFIQDGQVKGRPVDVLQLHDGSVLVSDDYAHKVYRVTYHQ
eukprot:TRINITY_DN1346_c0_g1_i1.p1 TRINITY_DN1346_c0_g1~~TRINITY_DN1346_c0_g1_i1.p1  ORF type:complete len:123 (-),score=11.68 TRINITY_DN1346_c0_g1_i1:4-372(-)